MNIPVSLELAILLMATRFDNIRASQYIQYSNDDWKLKTNQEYNDLDAEIGIGNNIRISAPTIAEVVMWLYDTYRIWIVVNIDIKDRWYFELFNLKDKRNAEILTNDKYWFDSPDEAYEAAIEYCLKELI